jgi:hypothetical protein
VVDVAGVVDIVEVADVAGAVAEEDLAASP